MAFIAPLLASVGPTLITGLSAVGTVVSAIGQAKAGNYQAALLERQAERERYTAQVQAQDQGLEAGQQIGAEVASQGASGFTLSSGSFARRRAVLDTLARRDSLRIVADGEAAALNAEADASQARSAARNSLLSGVLGVGSDLILQQEVPGHGGVAPADLAQ